MTQAEAERLASQIRTRCLHSSWNDLVDFWEGVVDNLETAHSAALRGVTSLHGTSTRDSSVDTQKVIVKELSTALSQLTGET